MTLPGRRSLALGGFLACCGMMGFALYAQHVLLLDPCPLCVLQRVVVIVLGTVFLAAALHDPAGWGRRVYAALIGLVAIGGIGIAGWHVRLQNLPPDEVPTCGPGLDYMLENFPLADAMRMVFEGSGECAEIAWSLFGLSMPAWVLVLLLFLGGAGAWNSLRQ
jgi:disulfide bond formation protein DsbB